MAKKMITQEEIDRFFGDVTDPVERFEMLANACLSVPIKSK